MPDYVYALHDFEPVHEDEITFRVGERVEVIEKDDLYNDGWWQGRNLAGQVGLFPVAYTTPSPPQEDPATSGHKRTPTAGSIKHATPDNASESHTRTDSTVMAATMTDVQEAIEQLGISPDGDHDAARSFSFSSAKDDTDHDSGIDTEDGDQPEDDEWRKDARKMLAQKAQREMEKREKAEAYTPRVAAPPIEAEMSEESDGEEEHGPSPGATRHKFPAILDGGKTAGTPTLASFQPARPAAAEPAPAIEVPPMQPALAESPIQHTPSSVPSRDSPSPPPRIHEDARPLGSPVLINAREVTTSTVPARPPSVDVEQTPRPDVMSSAFPQPLSTQQPPRLSSPAPAPPAETRVHHTPSNSIISGSTLGKPLSRPGSLTASRAHSYNGGPAGRQEPTGLERATTEVAASLPSPAASSLINGASLVSGTAPRSPLATAPSSVMSGVSTPPTQAKRPFTVKAHPSEWTVDQVVDWLKHKGFDDGVCAKFMEHEITGDVLLDLDANTLKEIDIVAFGKRVRIANAIHELNRPPSIVSSENSGRNGQMATPGSYHGPGHAVRQSVSSSAHQSYGSPIPRAANLISPESPPHTGDIVEPHAEPIRMRPGSDPGTDVQQRLNQVGLGFAASSERHRPAALNLSPSDGQLKARAAIADQILEDLQEESRVEDERAVMSEGETPQGLEQRTNKRRAAAQANEIPNDKASPTAAEARQRKKNSADLGKGSESTSRLSFLGGSIGKSRKPPPRVTSGEVQAADAPTEKHRTFGRLNLGSTKRPSSRAGDPVPSPRSENSPNALRKRTASVPDSARGGKVNLKPGVSIVDQIGEADYSGWMRKRGERYNTWKMRYFVLKGPHLYYLRSRNETKLKGYINILGYKVIADENANPGRYGFRIIHDNDKTHFFSSEEQTVVREWMKAIMKATIDRDYSRPVISSCNIPTIPLTVAQTMNPSPRPPSPGARDATQKALRRENPNQLSSRDARILMGLPQADGTQPGPPPVMDSETRRERFESFFSANDSNQSDTLTPPLSPGHPPPRPTREVRKPSLNTTTADADLIIWINSHVPKYLEVDDLTTSLSTGLVLFRVAESIKGRPSDVPDSIFPTGPNDDRLEGMFKLFDFLLDEDIKTGDVSISDVRTGRRDKIVQIVRALKAWEDKRQAPLASIGQGAVFAGPWLATAPSRH